MIDKIFQLFFDHNQILYDGYQRLRNKLEYSPMAFKILQYLFTLNYIYKIDTTILGKNCADYSNFISRLLKLGFLKDTKKKVSRSARKSATLYRFDAEAAEAFAPFKDKPFIFV